MITEAEAIKAVEDGLAGRNVPIVHEEIRVVLAMALERDTLRARAAEMERERDEATGEAAACVEFLRNLRDWHSFWEEGFLGEKTASASRQNGQALRAFLDETGHARRVVERLASLERDLDSARGLIARLGDADALESLDALLRHERARVAELERELEGMRQRAHAAEAQRDEARQFGIDNTNFAVREGARLAQVAWEQRHERDAARADTARLREALGKWERVVRDFRAGCGSSRNADNADEALLAFAAALASAPSAEPEGPDYSGLCSAPECGGHCGYTHAVGCEVIREYLAEHGGAPYKAPARTAHLAPSAPTPRDMRVAEAVREAVISVAVRWPPGMSEGDRSNMAATIRANVYLAAVVAKAKAVGT